MVNLEVFAKSGIILFMNKTDVFRKKLKDVSLNKLFKSFTGIPCKFPFIIRFIRG